MRYRIFGLLIALLIATSSSAQEATPDPLPTREPLNPPAMLRACTAEEIAAAADLMVGPSVTFDGLEDLETENQIQLAQLAASYEVLSEGHWYELMPQIPSCAEAFYFGAALGSFYDRHALYNIFTRVARFYRSFGEMDTTARYAELIRTQRRLMDEDEAQAIREALLLEETLPEPELSLPLPACGDLDMEVVTVLLSPDIERYRDLSGEVDARLDEDRVGLLEDYNALSETYWTEAFPALPGCAEAYELGIYVGRTFDSTYIAIALTDAVLMEAQHGDDEMTALLAGRLTIRAIAVAKDVETILSPLDDD